MFSLLIFDLDGTLIDSRKDIAFSVNQTLMDLSLSALPEETIYSCVGNGVSRLLADTVKSADPNLLEQANKLFERHYLAHLTDCTTLYPGMEAVLDHYRDKQKVVVTNKRAKFTRKIMDNLGVASHFECLITADEIGALKPDPAMLVFALQTTHRSAGEAIAIGDMCNDIRAARGAGVAICSVGYGFEEGGLLKAANPDFFAETVGDLATLSF